MDGLLCILLDVYTGATMTSENGTSIIVCWHTVELSCQQSGLFFLFIQINSITMHGRIPYYAFLRLFDVYELYIILSKVPYPPKFKERTLWCI
jgi:hypothetical protein